MKYLTEFEIQMLLLNEGFKMFQNCILSTSCQLSVKHISELSCIGLKLHANVNTLQLLFKENDSLANVIIL